MNDLPWLAPYLATGMEEEWEIVDYYPCLEEEDEDEGKSKVGWVMSVGKKVVMASFVMSSLPLLVPPLVVISALGLAFSVPFGVVFASYACTQKVMTKLLPPPPPHYVLDANQTFSPVHDDDDDEDGPPKFGIDDGTEIRIELVDDGDDNVMKEEEQEGLEARDVYVVGAAAASGIEKEEEKEEEDVRGGMEVRIELVDNARGEDVDEERGKEHDEIDVVKTRNGNGNEESKNVIDETAADKAPPSNGRLVVEKKETESRGGKRKPQKSKRKEAEKKHVKKEKATMNVVEAGIEVEETSSKENKANNHDINSQEKNGGPGKVLQSQTVVVPDDTGDVTDSEARIAELAENDEQMHHQNMKEAEVAKTVHSDEGFSGDEKMIWEKIDAVRVIVGFKAPKHPSYYDELKALYLFTGIEPPASTSSADFPEFCNKLSFLMSVIGLK